MQLLAISVVVTLCACSPAFVRSQGCSKQRITDVDPNIDISTAASSYSIGEVLRLRCKPGYIGLYKISCTENSWQKQLARPCAPKSCGHPGDTNNGDFTLEEKDDFVIGATVTYTCRQGYYMASRINYRTCQMQGWDNSVPICEVIRCPTITPKDGVIAIGRTEEASYQDVVSFQCKLSHMKISGWDEIYCTKEGTWSNPDPICIEIKCQAVAIPHGRVIQQKELYLEDETLKFACDEGYRSREGRYPKCTSTGWSITPECEEITCLLQPGVYNRVTQPAGKTIFKPGQFVEVTCREGFIVIFTKDSTSKIRCGRDGEWEKQPICEEMVCDIPREDFLRSAYWYFQGGRKLGATKTYYCVDGYYQPAKQATCTTSGWHPDPLCVEIMCDKPNIPNSKLQRSSKQKYKLSERLEYQCLPGYEPERTTEIVCGRSTTESPQGVWKYIRPCTAKEGTCPALNLEHGYEVRKSTNTVYYACEPGFKPYAGTWWASVTCVEGKWLDTPLCINQQSCGALPDVPFALKKTGEKRTRQTEQFECIPGYKSVPTTIECKNGDWETPVCEPEACPPPGHVENAVITHDYQDFFAHGIKLQYKCREKFEIDGHDLLTCDKGTWDKEIPKCISSTCEPPETEKNHARAIDTKAEYNKGETVQYECFEGYVFKEIAMATCGNGDWTYPECIRDTDCSRPVNEMDVVEIISSKEKYKSNETLNYRCRAPYNKMAGGHLTCQEGQWDGLFQCTSETCPLPPGIQNGRAVVEQRDSESVITEVSYTCDEHYSLSSRKTIKCVNGKWDETPTCEKVTCVREDSDNIKIERLSRGGGAQDQPGDSLRLSCRGSNFYLKGDEVVTCLRNGSWNKPFPTCEEITCRREQRDDVRIVKIPSSSGAGDKPGDKLRFSCSRSNMVLKGAHEVTCQVTGEWDQSFPICEEEKGNCGPPPPALPAEVRDIPKLEYEDGEKVEYLCPKYYTMKFQSFMTCQQGQWIGEIACHKPCTITKDQMAAQNIQLKWKENDKMYATHNDWIGFSCVSNTRHRSSGPALRQQCIDGVMALPSCY